MGPTGTTGHGRAAEALRLRMPTLAPPAAGPARGPWASGGPEELRDSDRACGPFAVTSDRLLSIHTAGHGQCSLTALFPIGAAALGNSRCGVLNICRLNWDPLVLKQTARKLVSPVTTQIVCESRRHSLFRRQSTQQQEQSAGSTRVKRLYPKHTVQQLGSPGFKSMSSSGLGSPSLRHRGQVLS